MRKYTQYYTNAYNMYAKYHFYIHLHINMYAFMYFCIHIWVQKNPQFPEGYVVNCA